MSRELDFIVARSTILLERKSKELIKLACDLDILEESLKFTI